MNLQSLKTLLQEFEAFLLKQKGEPENLFFWEALQYFQSNWNLEAPDLAEMYSNSLQSNRSRTLWKRENFFPRDRMLEFINLEPEFVRSAFRELMQENKGIEARVTNFAFHCDQLMEEYKRVYPTTIETNHFHSDYQMIFLYLSFSKPDQYCLYHYDGFKKFLQLVKSPQPLLSHDVERYTKVSKTVDRFISDYPSIHQYYHQHLKKPEFYQGKTLFPVFTFYSYIASL